MLGNPIIEMVLSSVGTAVLHFIWQGALIGLIAAVALACVRRGSAPMRYAIACTAMACCMITFLVTLVLALQASAGVAPSVGGTPLRLADLIARPMSGGPVSAIESQLDGIAGLWLAGVAFFSARFCLQWRSARRLTLSGVSQPDDHWQQMFDAIKRDLGIRRATRLLCSRMVEAPMVVGWISPIVLVPASIFTSLSPEQLRAVLAHELSHIRRHDHLVNAAQVAIETTLFFHPAVWWLSRCARTEREHCCDDAAVITVGSPQIFAEALAMLETLRQTHPQAALAANGGPLMNRISRILATRTNMPLRWPRTRSILALTAGAVVVATGIAHAARTVDQPERDQALQLLRDAAAVGTPTEQVRELYDLLVFRGSEQEQRLLSELASIEAELEAAVQAGKVSEEEAKEKLAYVRNEFANRVELEFSMDVLGMTKGEAYLTITRRDLAEMVRAGSLGQAEADRKLAELERGVDLREEYALRMKDAEATVKDLVAAGELTSEEGRERLAGMRREIEMRAHLHGMEMKIAAAVEAGDITREEAADKLEAVRREMAGEKSRTDVDWEAIKHRIEGAVERGDMTREEAEAAYAGVKERMAGATKQTDIDWDAIKARIEGAVERGDMTREEADQAFAEIKERAAAGERDTRRDDMNRRLASALVEAGIDREQIRPAMGALERIVYEIRAEGDEFELDAGMREWLQGQGLTADQIEKVVGLAHRVAAASKKRSAEHDGGR